MVINASLSTIDPPLPAPSGPAPVSLEILSLHTSPIATHLLTPGLNLDLPWEYTFLPSSLNQACDQETKTSVVKEGLASIPVLK